MEAKAILAEAGVPSAQEKLVNSADDAAAAASNIGYPLL